jgi:transposase
MAGRCLLRQDTHLDVLNLTRRPAIALELKTLLNFLNSYKGFVFGEARLLREAKAIEVELRADSRCAARCGCCGHAAPLYDCSSKPRKWEHVPLWGLKVFFIYVCRRVNCRRCVGVKVELIPWSLGKSPVTREAKIFLARWARRLSWKEVATVFRTSWESVYRSVAWVVEWGLANRNLVGVEAIGVDEWQWSKGKKSKSFVTLIYQIDEGCKRLLWVGLSRKKRALMEGLKSLGPEVLAGIRYVCSDMWKPYLKAVAQMLPRALNILDPFHVMKKVNEAVDEVRLGEMRRLRAAKATDSAAGQRLKGMKFVLLRRGSKVRGSARKRLKALLHSMSATARAWMHKEALREFWKYRSATWAMGFLDVWCERVMRSRLKPMMKVAEMLLRHRELLRNYFVAKRRFSSGTVEGLNLKCGLVSRRSYGFKTIETTKIALYHNLGKLPEPPSTHEFC